MAPASVAPAAYLQRPANTTTLAGKVKIDASYILSNHGASLVSNNGGQVLAAGGSIISEHGGALATASGNIVANNGSTLTAKAKRVLLAEEPPAYGTQLPAAAMRVQVFDLDTGKALALGTDAAGQPVDAIYTNLAGGFEVYLPAAAKGNVRVVAEVPGHADPRLTYHVLTAPGAGDRTVDEDSATVARYLRQVFRDKFANLMSSYGQVGAGAMTDDELVNSLFTANKLAPAFQALLKTFIQDLFKEIRANPNITDGSYQELGLLLGDEVLSQSGDLDAIPLSPAFYAGPEQQALIEADPLHPTRVMEAFAGVIGDLRLGVTRQGAGKTVADVEADFAARPYMQAANRYHARVHPQDPVPFYAIRKPSDFTDFIALEYLTMVDQQPYGCVKGDCPPPDPACQLIDLCFPAGGQASISNSVPRHLEERAFTDVGVPTSHIDVLTGATQGLVASVVARCFDPVVNARMHCLIRTYRRPEATCDAP
jgi:hypothetical protein